MSEPVIVVAANYQESLTIEQSLAPDGIRVLPATTMLDAVLQQAATRAEVIIYDTDVPVSWQLALRQFLHRNNEARVVFLSRLADDQMWMDVLDNGGYDLVMKPFLPQELRAVVRNALSPTFHRAAA